MVLVVINGNKERIDKYCGNHTPVQLMSNGPLLMVEFRSYQKISTVHPIDHSVGHLLKQPDVKMNPRGFKATYKFINGKLTYFFYLYFFFLT